MMSPRLRYVDLLAHLDQARSAGMSFGLERTRAVLARLGDPQRRAVTVHIAGTNGKGSTAAMTEAILRAGGLHTGLYTSPHLSRFTERIRVDGEEADGDLLARLLPPIIATGIPLTYFELATVLAFRFFAEAPAVADRESLDVVVMETGLGGRLDATTACEPVATAITSIALDHAEFLGGTLAEIAREKAGIAKPGVPLFLAPVPPDADAAIAAVAASVGAPLFRLGEDFALPPHCPVALSGAHQRSNAALAVALARAAAAKAGRPLDSEAVARGLRQVVWPGRLETVGDLLLDCAHNTEGAAMLARALDEMAGMADRRPRALLCSVVAGKPAREILDLLAPRFDAVFVTQSSNPRSLSSAALQAILQTVASPQGTPPVVNAIEDPLRALAAARAWLHSHQNKNEPSNHRQGLIVAAGSTFLVGDLRAALLGEARDPLPTSDPVSLHQR